jgi:LmbE family N-acetylglucosaminyl deacetylase
MKILAFPLRRILALVSTVLLMIVPQRVAAQFPPAPGTGPGLAETIEAIDGARVTTRILYITAHPDDESATLLTYLARRLHSDVALLSLTRGEGGQNDLGPEQAPQLGFIRTQELLAATHGYGIKLFFTRAPDFGFSKTPEETQKVWGDQVLGDMVRVIRTFRPNIVVNGWGGVHGGHGHHQTSGLWTPRAVALASDPKAFPEQIGEGLEPWGTEANPVQVLDTERGGRAAAANGYELPVDEVSPLWGKTWREIALDAFANHRSQGITGFFGSPFLRRPLLLVREDGRTFDPRTLAEPLSQFWTVLPVHKEILGRVDQLLQKAEEQTLQLDWVAAAKSVAAAGHDFEEGIRTLAVASHPGGQHVHAEADPVLLRIQHALALVAGIDVQAEANRSELVVGESFMVTGKSRCRKEAGCVLDSLQLNLPQGFKEIKREGDDTKGYELTVAVSQPAPAWPIWARLLPEPPPLVLAQQGVTVDGYKFSVKTPVTHIAANSTRVDRVPLRIVPAFTLAVEPRQQIEALAKQRKPFDVLLRVHSYATQAGKASLGVEVPHGWTSSAPTVVEFDGAGDKYAKLTVTQPQKLAAGNYRIAAYANRGEEKFTTSLEPLPSLPTQLWEEPAQCVVRAFDITMPDDLRVGYVTAESEPIPEALRMLDIHVETLDAGALAFSDLSKFDAMVVGVRAYELRPELPGANQRLLDYVSGGGTLLVQYQRDFEWDKFQYAPYPALISPPLPAGKEGAPQAPRPLPRITDENSPVKFLKRDDPLLNMPNKITGDDFKGWVQERGLYFWTQFDSKYTPLLAMNDPGEPDLNGALVYTHYGKGIYIYTGLAFFRQLPEGVPGAYRLFVNLLSASRTK